MPILLEEDLRRPLPRMYRVRQRFDETCLTDIEGTVRREMAKPEVRARVKPGMRVAVGVGTGVGVAVGAGVAVGTGLRVTTASPPLSPSGRRKMMTSLAASL